MDHLMIRHQRSSFYYVYEQKHVVSIQSKNCSKHNLLIRKLIVNLIFFPTLNFTNLQAFFTTSLRPFHYFITINNSLIIQKLVSSQQTVFNKKQQQQIIRSKPTTKPRLYVISIPLSFSKCCFQPYQSRFDCVEWLHI
jgi:hypothetical protein